jgi:hypothetical protein
MPDPKGDAMADYAGQILAPSELQATPDSANAQILVSGQVSSALYAQRVWSTGLGAWCSWIGPIDSSPTPAMTTPNWTGSITSYECVSRRLN